MALFAIYQKSKRAKNLWLVAWPIDAANAAGAIAKAIDERQTRGETVKRLRVYGPYSANDNPPETIHHNSLIRTGKSL